MVGLITTGTAQSLALAESLGVDPALFLDAIAGSAVDSPYAHVKGRAMLAGDWTTSFAVDGVPKDIDLMLDAAAEASFRPGCSPRCASGSPRRLRTLTAGTTWRPFAPRSAG